MEVKKIEPDFRMDKPEDTISVVINTKEYAQSRTISSEQIVFTGATPKIDYYYQGRQLTFTFASVNYFEMGHVMITVNLVMVNDNSISQTYQFKILGSYIIDGL